MKTLKTLFVLVIVVLCVNPSYAQLKVATNGNIGINLSTGTAPLTKLHINGSCYLPLGQSYWIGSVTDAGCRLRLHVSAPNAYIDSYSKLNFRTSTNGTYITNIPMTITATGVGINNESPSCNLDVTGTAKVNGAIILTSDARIKENIQSLSGSLTKLSNLSGVTYKLKIPNTKNSIIGKSAANLQTAQTDTTGTTMAATVIDTALYNRNHIGFIAQDIQKVFPELVYEDKNGMLAVDYISLIPVLVESIKEQQGQFDKLIKEIEALKQENLKLKKKVGL